MYINKCPACRLTQEQYTGESKYICWNECSKKYGKFGTVPCLTVPILDCILKRYLMYTDSVLSRYMPEEKYKNDMIGKGGWSEQFDTDAIAEDEI